MISKFHAIRDSCSVAGRVGYRSHVESESRWLMSQITAGCKRKQNGQLKCASTNPGSNWGLTDEDLRKELQSVTLPLSYWCVGSVVCPRSRFVYHFHGPKCFGHAHKALSDNVPSARSGVDDHR